MDLLEALKIILIGIVEGITEWLPISSTGHMLLFDEFLKLNMTDAFKSVFIYVIQLGAILAVVVVFWKKMFPFSFREKPHVKTDILLLWLKVALACVPGLLAGVFLDDIVEAKLSTPMVIAAVLIIYGALFIIVERWNKKRKPRIKKLSDIDYTTALLIGLFQVLAIIPGTSRSGATIIGALLIGVSRVAAAEFTFFLAVPVMFGASALKLIGFGGSFAAEEVIALVLGSAVAFVVSLFVIRFLMSYIKKHDFQAFGWYRIALGAVLIVYFAFAN